MKGDLPSGSCPKNMIDAIPNIEIFHHLHWIYSDRPREKCRSVGARINECLSRNNHYMPGLLYLDNCKSSLMRSSKAMEIIKGTDGFIH